MKGKLSLMSVLLAGLLAPQIAAQYTWTHNPATGHWYTLSSTADTFDSLQAEAESLDGHLVVINDQAENNFLSSSFTFAANGAWIGLYQDLNSPNYSEPHGGWTWVNGDPVNYTFWNAGEPSNGGGHEHHATILSISHNYRWNDNVGDNSLYGVFETENNPYGPTLTVTDLVAGQLATATCSDNDQGEWIAIGYSLAGPGPTTTPYGILELSNPYTQLKLGPADASGSVSTTRTVPQNVAGITVWIDALNVTTGESPPGVSMVIL